MGKAENEDSFMIAVGKNIEEMFPATGPGIDTDLQERVIRTMYERRTVIPFFKGDGEVSFGPGEDSQFDILRDTKSL